MLSVRAAFVGRLFPGCLPARSLYCRRWPKRSGSRAAWMAEDRDGKYRAVLKKGDPARPWSLDCPRGQMHKNALSEEQKAPRGAGAKSERSGSGGSGLSRLVPLFEEGGARIRIVCPWRPVCHSVCDEQPSRPAARNQQGYGPCRDEGDGGTGISVDCINPGA